MAGMKRRYEEAKWWQFGLQKLFGVLALVGATIWALQHIREVILTLRFIPFLLIAIAFEWAGYSEIAIFVLAFIGALWMVVVLWSM